MECVSPILDVATRLWDCTSQRAVYVRKLEGNLKNLKSKMEELNNLSKDVMERVEREEELQQSRRTHEVDGWLHAAHSMVAEVEDILRNWDEEIQKKCLRLCPKNCWSNYKLGKIVIEKIDEVTELMGKGRFDVVTRSLPCPPVVERLMGDTVGLDLMFEKVQRCLVDEQVRSIGLFGMGGVGKTTLLQKINNDFFGKRSDFGVVMWVVVSKPINIEQIQEKILKRLNIPEDIWKSSSKEEKATRISDSLKAKTFAILLDDMWERLDLSEVGIPALNNQTKSKVVITTRSQQVCSEMTVDHAFKVECLTPDEAFSLFSNHVGEKIIESHPDIKILAKQVVEECKGLPLALIVIGRSMASRRTPREWQQGIEMLRSYPAKFPGMDNKVFPKLKFSYDNLENSTIKSCFLFCSLFPEDYTFEKEDLINLWIGEGLLSEYYDTYEARNQGEEMIRNLKLACLLESGEDIITCKMHDVMHDMGQWILCDCGKEKQKKIIAEYFKVVEEFEIARWEVAQRILLWHSDFKEKFSVSPNFPNLQTFIMRNSDMKSLPIGFFHFMPNIRVLDLSDNKNLEELPLEIWRLESLEYLNLAWTSIKELPVELKELKKLKLLILDRMDLLQAIPPEVIPCFSNLQMFNMTDHAQCIEGYDECLQELECLPCLSEISISLRTSSAYKIFLSSQKLQKCTQYLSLRVDDCQGFLVLPISTLQRLKRLLFYFCTNFEGLKIDKQSDQQEQRSMFPCHISNSCFHNLVTVTVITCSFVDLTWLVYSPCLEELQISYCREMEEVIGADGESAESEIEELEEHDHSIFSRLSILHLHGLPKMKSICKRPLSFPSLTDIYVIECPNLRKLPLNSDSATNTLKTIRGFRRWWEQLEWESDLVKATFAPYFVSI